jgi:hypothetical protein
MRRTMAHRIIFGAIVYTLWFAPTVLDAQQVANPTAAALAEFTKHATAYMDLHKKQEAAALDIKAGASPAEVLAFEKVLAGRMKAARAAAKQGEIFTPDVVPVFKQIFADYYQRRTGRELRLLFDEVPNFKPQVNGIYPINAPKATFPPRLSLALPTLPDELEFRLVGTSLVLRDTEANLVVDYIPNVLPPAAKPKP